MKPAQFAALAQLLRMQDGPAMVAAALVLVDGARPTDAAAVAGCSRASASNAVSRMRRGLDLAQQAAGAPQPG
jgi:hypothetical protein